MVVTVFKLESEGYQALTELKQAAEGENHFVTAAALVKKEGNTTPTILRRWTVSDMKRMYLYPDVFKPGFLRFSIGLEDPEDIVNDLDQALRAVGL